MGRLRPVRLVLAVGIAAAAAVLGGSASAPGAMGGAWWPPHLRVGGGAALAQEASNQANPLGIRARSAVLLDAATGSVLYSFNEDDRMQPASLAKIMTFELILEALRDRVLSPDTTATVSEEAWRLALDNTRSNMFLEVGERVKVGDLLPGLMVASGNDAALVLAEARSGSEAAFVALMNERARRLGLKDTRYANSHGLSAPDQYTTARDVAALSRHVVLDHPDALRITGRKEFTHAGITQPNWNGLVLTDPRVDGLKTGHLPEVGYHLAATAKEGDMRLIAVVMGVQDDRERGISGQVLREKEAQRLLEYGFRNFATVRPAWRRALPAGLTVYKGRRPSVGLTLPEPVVLTLRRGEEARLRLAPELAPYAVAPVRKGQELGRLRILLGEKEVASRPVVAAEAVPPGGLWRRLWDTLRLLVKSLLPG